jgi:hypothetical protein
LALFLTGMRLAAALSTVAAFAVGLAGAVFSSADITVTPKSKIEQARDNERNMASLSNKVIYVTQRIYLVAMGQVNKESEGRNAPPSIFPRRAP